MGGPLPELRHLPWIASLEGAGLWQCYADPDKLTASIDDPGRMPSPVRNRLSEIKSLSVPLRKEWRDDDVDTKPSNQFLERQD